MNKSEIRQKIFQKRKVNISKKKIKINFNSILKCLKKKELKEKIKVANTLINIKLMQCNFWKNIKKKIIIFHCQK